MTIVAATGHRPDKLGGWESYENEDFLRAAGDFAVERLKELQATKVICGMAAGWDQIVGVAAASLGLPLLAAIPCKGQELVWPEASMSRVIFDILKEYAHKNGGVFIISDGDYAPYKMQVRNRWMVDRCEILLALWNGTYGGTMHCVEYAMERNKIRGKPVIDNVWGQFQRTVLQTAQASL